jgi:hypothetical protein
MKKTALVESVDTRLASEIAGNTHITATISFVVEGNVNPSFIARLGRHLHNMESITLSNIPSNLKKPS